MSDNALSNGIFQAFIDWLYSSGDISVPADFHNRCGKIQEMLDNDISGTINTILDYAVNSASEANYRIECSEKTLQKLLNLWLEEINIDIKDIPTGLQALSKEYFKERWEGSSFCILRISNWKKITLGNVTIEVPKTMWFVNGGSIYVVRPKEQIYKLGTDKYYLNKEETAEIPKEKNEEIIIQKPYNRWFDQYPTPYLIRKGIYKNWLAMKTLQDKSDEVISKILPYLFVIQKGTAELFKDNNNYSDEELKDLTQHFKEGLESYKNQKGKTPINTVPFDTKYDHLIPDLSKVLKEELYRQGYRSILSGLGFIDMLEIAPSRQESRLNPKAFMSEVNEGVCGFKSLLLEAIYLIEQKNKEAHKKLFSEKGKLIIVNSPLKINVENLLSDLRSGYDRGVISIKSYQEILGVDPETERERRESEAKNGDEDLMYPHIINNQEEKGKDTFAPSKPKNEENENQDKKKGTPETEKFKNAGIELIIAPYDISNPPAFLKKYPEGAQKVFIEVFNKALPKGEDYAFPVAYTAMKRWLKKHGYKKVNDKWVKEEENK